jgi:hypothetical protein
MRLANGRALAGENAAWFAVAAAAWLFLRVRRKRGAAVFSLPLRPGQQLLVTVREQQPGEDFSGAQ